MAMLADLVESLEAAEATLASMHAARDGLLALAGRLAVDIARQGDHPDGADMTIRTVAAEIGAVQRVSDRTVERRISQASWLVDGFPAVWQAQGAGRVSAAHAAVIVEAGGHLTDAGDRAAFAAAVLPIAEAESPNRLRPLARRIAERFQPRSIDERHRAARDRRRVWSVDAEDGMGDLHIHTSATLAHGMMDRLSKMAHAIREENRRAARDAKVAGDVTFEPDERTVDEIRADLLVDLVLTGAPTGHDTTDGLLGEIRAEVEVTVPVTSLIRDDAADDHLDDDIAGAGDGSGDHATGVADELAARFRAASRIPAELDGIVPIDAATARALAGNAVGWNRVLTHPITGAVLAVDRYRPNKDLRRLLKARDQRCRFPGCRIAARKCDLDHNHSASTGGATCDENLAAFCRRHHMLKHSSPWQVTPRPGGVLEWTSPTGRTYVDRPPPPHTVVFSESHMGRSDADLVPRVPPPF